MRFSNKLSKLRKNNNLSQEQLADKLGVSRQAVSKWESGLTYPDMEKIIQLCKLLDCNLEDLLDDGVIGESKETENKNNIENIFHDFLNYITKSYNMFCSMSFKNKIKCLLELIIFSIIMIIMSYMFITFIDLVLFGYLDYSYNSIIYIIKNAINSILYIALFILGMVIILHIFKIRYLDYYVTIEDRTVNEQTIEKPVDVEIKENQKEKIIIRDPKHSTSSFLDYLAGIVAIIIKGLVIIFSIPVCLLFTFLVAIAVFILSCIKYGSVFLYSFVIILGLILFTFIIIKLIYYFLFNRKNNHIFNFSFIIASFILMGTGAALVSSLLTTFDIVYDDEKVLKNKEVINLNYHDNMVLISIMDDYVIDNNKEDITIETYCQNYAKPQIEKYDEYNNKVTFTIYHVNYIYNGFEVYHEFIDNLKNKKLYVNDRVCKTQVHLSQVNYDKLMNNYHEMTNYTDE